MALLLAGTQFQSPHLEALKSFSRSLGFALQLKASFATRRTITAYCCLLFKVMKWFFPPVNLSIIPLSSVVGKAVSQLSGHTYSTVRIHWHQITLRRLKLPFLPLLASLIIPINNL